MDKVLWRVLQKGDSAKFRGEHLLLFLESRNFNKIVGIPTTSHWEFAERLTGSTIPELHLPVSVVRLNVWSHNKDHNWLQNANITASNSNNNKGALNGTTSPSSSPSTPVSRILPVHIFAALHCKDNNALKLTRNMRNMLKSKSNFKHLLPLCISYSSTSTSPFPPTLCGSLAVSHLECYKIASDTIPTTYTGSIAWYSRGTWV